MSVMPTFIRIIVPRKVYFGGPLFSGIALGSETILQAVKNLAHTQACAAQNLYYH